MNSPTDLESRIEQLEERIAHQDAAVDELTRTVLRQEQSLKQQADAIDSLQRQVRLLGPVPPSAPGDDELPPHY